jgi:hypothetical protein
MTISTITGETPDTIQLRMTKDVPPAVCRLMTDLLNLPYWQFMLFLDELNSIIDDGFPSSLLQPDESGA